MLSFETNRRGAVSGPLVVCGMIVFGLILSSLLWTYWYLHTAPFDDLQVAIGTEFKHSVPRVRGGQRRIHKGTPRLLWIVMRLDFNPKDDTERARKVADRVVEISQEHVDLHEYEQLNLRQYFGEPEKAVHQVDFQIPLEDSRPGEPELMEDAGA